MDYLDRANDLEEVQDNYYQIIYDLIQTKMNNHFDNYHSAPRYLLVGEQKLWEVARIMFYMGFPDEKITHYAQIYKQLVSSSDNFYYGLRVILVGNDLNFLEVA